MKLIILSVLCLSAVAFNDKQKVVLDTWGNIFQPNRNECIKQSGASDSSIDAMFTTLEFPDNYNFKCYFRCQYTKLNLIDDKGNFNLPFIFENVSADETDIIKECAIAANQKSDDKQKVVLDTWGKIFQPNRNECIKLSGASDSSIDAMFITLEFPDNYNIKCYFRCQYTKLNLIDDKGNFNLPVIFEYVSADETDIIKECAIVANQKSDVCEKVYAFAECVTPKIMANYN
ncbi:hypothetical protein FQA39_LY14061 [Lamprigera yunnana]|nr:hypothetical protein FQA39_LY14061 [Lamprigera yunnana]